MGIIYNIQLFNIYYYLLIVDFSPHFKRQVTIIKMKIAKYKCK